MMLKPAYDCKPTASPRTLARRGENGATDPRLTETHTPGRNPNQMSLIQCTSPQLQRSTARSVASTASTAFETALEEPLGENLRPDSIPCQLNIPGSQHDGDESCLSEPSMKLPPQQFVHTSPLSRPPPLVRPRSSYVAHPRPSSPSDFLEEDQKIVDKELGLNFNGKRGLDDDDDTATADNPRKKRRRTEKEEDLEVKLAAIKGRGIALWGEG